MTMMPTTVVTLNFGMTLDRLIGRLSPSVISNADSFCQEACRLTMGPAVGKHSNDQRRGQFCRRLICECEKCNRPSYQVYFESSTDTGHRHACSSPINTLPRLVCSQRSYMHSVGGPMGPHIQALRSDVISNRAIRPAKEQAVVQGDAQRAVSVAARTKLLLLATGLRLAAKQRRTASLQLAGVM